MVLWVSQSAIELCSSVEGHPRRHLFNSDDDAILKNLRQTLPTETWPNIAEIMSELINCTVSAHQCRDRWLYYLSGQFPQMPREWTQDDQDRLNQRVADVGTKWAMLALEFPGWSDNHLKNKYWTCQKRGGGPPGKRGRKPNPPPQEVAPPITETGELELSESDRDMLAILNGNLSFGHLGGDSWRWDRLF